MKYYRLTAETCVEEYVRPGIELMESLGTGCANSEFQYLDHDDLEIEIDDASGMEFPDFLLNYSIPLISDRFKKLLDLSQVDNLFYKRVVLTARDLGIKEYYWLALPPRINCLNWQRSQLEVEDNPYVPEQELMRRATNIVVNSPAVGNYQIFKISFVENQDIIITEALYRVLAKANLTNVYFREMKGE